MPAIIVPIDFSDATEPVLEEAERLGRAFEAQLVLVHVAEPAAQMVGGDPGFDMVQMPLNIDTKPQEKRLATLAQQLNERGLEATPVVTAGFAVDEILEQIRTHAAAYVVLGSHGHGALYHLFAGGVVTGVLKAGACPAVVVPVSGKTRGGT